MKDDDDGKISVLVIEDDEVFKQFLKKFLKEKGMNVSLASNGLEGLAKIEKQHFDLIITDLKMPKMNGMDFLKELKNKKGNDVAVIVLTAYGEMDNYVQAIDWGVYEFLHKPVDVEVLSEIIEKAVSERNIRKNQ
ncbi:MAG: response regulator [Candidatus Schekmanbacteria bacterium]|nr:MAG: response regulator [Candidatus Schekmanbacteria bacterium]